MAAFVGGAGLWRSEKSGRSDAVGVVRRTRGVSGGDCGRVRAMRGLVVRMMAEGEGSEEAGASAAPMKKEPYPGYFKDLERSGGGAVAEPKKKKREAKVGGKKSMYRADGTAYAPWMVGQVIEEPDEFVPIAPKTDAVGKMAKDPQQQELAGSGLKWKLLGDELELTWATGDETGNVGFMLQKRRGKSDKFELVDDYKSLPATFQSKGPAGGVYSYLGPKPEPGTWIYRVSDVAEDGTVSDLSQTLVEIESDEDSKKQRIAVIVFAVIALALFAAGFLSDPHSGL
uniref:Uncharacterized protein n=1 Tax=Erythrolobus madagascarensis TaxID=708628 RepID=A0A7S0T6E7_9RHOD